MNMLTRPDPGQPPDFVEAVFTCKGDYYDPNFPHQFELLNQRLQNLLNADHKQLVIKKVEPWNSVKVTVNIPKEVAERLKTLASQNDGAALRNMGIMSLQMEGDRIISLTLSKPSGLRLPGSDPLGASTSSTGNSDTARSANSLHHNLFNLPNTSSTSCRDSSDKGLMQPPPNLATPLVLPKPKPERRQRKTVTSKTSGSRARTSKSKATLASGKNPGTNSPAQLTNTSSALSSDMETTTDSVSTPASTVVNHIVPHPALKDTKLSSLPSSSLAADKIDDRMQTNELLASLFERSLANSNSANMLLPPNTLSDLANKDDIIENKRQRLQDDKPEHRAASIPSPDTNSSQLINLNTECKATPLSAHTESNDECSATPTRSEHVSVIAGLTTSHSVSSPQTEAMDLSHPEASSSNDTQLTDAVANDSPMLCLSTRSKTVDSPTTPLTPPVSLPDTCESVDVNPDIQNTVTLSEVPEPSPDRDDHVLKGDHGGDPPTVCSVDSSISNSNKASAVIDKQHDIVDSIPEQHNLNSPESSHLQTNCHKEEVSADVGTPVMVSPVEKVQRSPSPAYIENVNNIDSNNTDSSSSEPQHIEVENDSPPVESVHGKPVSVICSTVDGGSSAENAEEADKEKAEKLNKEDEHSEVFHDEELPANNEQIDELKHNNPTISMPAVILNDNTNNEHLHNEFKPESPTETLSRKSPNADADAQISSEVEEVHVDTQSNMHPAKPESEIISTLPKYNGPTPPQHLTTADHEPTENGSSTSTDSGVVPGSPKSDICPTPPSVEEPHLAKAELDVEIATVEVEKTESAAAVMVTIPPVVSSNTIIIPQSTSQSQPNVNTHSNTNRPCVSILKTTRPVQTKVITGESNAKSSQITPITTKVITPESKVTTAATFKSAQHGVQAARPADTASYLMHSPANVSNMLLAAATAASNNRPYIVVPRDQCNTHVRTGGNISRQDTELLNLVNPRIVVNKSRKIHTAAQKTLLLSSRNDPQIVFMDKRHSGHENQEVTSIPAMQQHIIEPVSKPAYIISKEGVNNGNTLRIKTSDTNTLLMKNVMISQSKESRAQHPVIAPSNPVTPISIVSSINGPKASTVIVSQVNASNPMILTPASQMVNLQSTASSIQTSKVKTVISSISSSAPIPLQLPAVTVINSPVAGAINSPPATSSTTQDNSEQSAIPPAEPNVDVAASAKVVPENKCDEEGSNLPVSEIASLQTAVVEDVKDSILLTDHNVSSDIINDDATGLVNGISGDNDTHETDSSQSGTNVASISPSSVSSSVLEVQTSDLPIAAAVLSSPGQRKSGRVRTLRSPDPDYITPSTKVRKRGARQISEESNPSDTALSALTAATPKKGSKTVSGKSISAVEAVSDSEPASSPIPQTNGPTSRSKRSTRSSGLSDPQALPTVYRDRKRTKR